MRTLLTYCVDTLFPPSAETLLVRRLTPKDVTRLYEPHTVHEVTALTPFSSPVLRALIHEAKFKGNERSYALLARLLMTHLLSHPNLRTSTFVPIPLSRERKRERGYNQVARILTALKRELPDIHIDESLLTRSRHTRPQTELKKAERIANLTGAFTCPRPGYIRGKTLVLIDDVTTTGATLKEAEKALLPHKPHMIILIAIGH